MSLFMAGALFGEVQVPLFVAGALFDSRSKVLYSNFSLGGP